MYIYKYMYVCIFTLLHSKSQTRFPLIFNYVIIGEVNSYFSPSLSELAQVVGKNPKRSQNYSQISKWIPKFNSFFFSTTI